MGKLILFSQSPRRQSVAAMSASAALTVEVVDSSHSLERAPVHALRLQSVTVQVARHPAQAVAQIVSPPSSPVLVGFAQVSVGQAVALPTGELPAAHSQQQDSATRPASRRTRRASSHAPPRSAVDGTASFPISDQRILPALVLMGPHRIQQATRSFLGRPGPRLTSVGLAGSASG